MKARPHVIFFRSQHTVKLDLPNDVFYDLMALSKQVNLLIGCFCPSPQKRGLRLFQNKPLLAQWSYVLCNINILLRWRIITWLVKVMVNHDVKHHGMKKRS